MSSENINITSSILKKDLVEAKDKIIHIILPELGRRNIYYEKNKKSIRVESVEELIYYISNPIETSLEANEIFEIQNQDIILQVTNNKIAVNTKNVTDFGKIENFLEELFDFIEKDKNNINLKINAFDIGNLSVSYALCKTTQDPNNDPKEIIRKIDKITLTNPKDKADRLKIGLNNLKIRFLNIISENTNLVNNNTSNKVRFPEKYGQKDSNVATYFNIAKILGKEKITALTTHSKDEIINNMVRDIIDEARNSNPLLLKPKSKSDFNKSINRNTNNKPSARVAKPESRPVSPGIRAKRGISKNNNKKSIDNIIFR